MFNTLTVRTWDLMIPRPSWVLVTNPDRQLPCHFSKTVLRIPSKWELPVFRCLHDGPVPPAMRQTPADLPRCSSRQGWPGRTPVPDVRWLHRDKGKCLWTFSFCSNARSFDRPTVAKPGEKIKVPIFIRRKGADAFRPALAAGGSLMAYRCLLLCGLFFFKGFCKSLFQIGFDFSQVVSRPLHCEAENLLLFRVSEIAGIVFERFLP